MAMGGSAVGIALTAEGTGVGVLLGSVLSGTVRRAVGWAVSVVVDDAQLQPARTKTNKSKQQCLNMGPSFSRQLCTQFTTLLGIVELNCPGGAR